MGRRSSKALGANRFFQQGDIERAPDWVFDKARLVCVVADSGVEGYIQMSIGVAPLSISSAT